MRRGLFKRLEESVRGLLLKPIRVEENAQFFTSQKRPHLELLLQIPDRLDPDPATFGFRREHMHIRVFERIAGATQDHAR
jgi:hypothetical protein